ncbi:hypothetical protein HK097_008603 [Rhizophlyctis rosea]|uniref:JmjC domain-containing protein n=1 Tax=Rhizophlyctis rosea TaxID=64517 RepID=A0AAD5SDB4_9FUNG|nr:hypothetical protein HK097_008603 [Rhizophlyctis rosea]
MVTPDITQISLTDLSSPLHPDNLVPITRKSWPPENGSFVYPTHSARQPVILTETFVSQWPARNKWTSLQYLNKHLPSKINVARNTDRYFVHHDASPQFPLAETNDPTFERDVIPRKQFWERITEDRSHRINPSVLQRANAQMTEAQQKLRLERTKQNEAFPGLKKSTADDGKLYYFNSMVPDLNAPTLLSDVPSSYRTLVVDDFAPSPDGTPSPVPRPPGSNPDRGEIKLWIGSQGVVANLHYDATQNFYLQIRGRKRFLLISPEHWENVHCHPRLHPSDRQSMTHFLKAETDAGWSELKSKFPLIQNVKGHVIEAFLDEGEVLYIPPFWFHNVESLDAATVSVNVWSSSREEDLYMFGVLQNAAPYLNDPTINIKWTPAITAMATQVYLALLVKAVEGIDDNFLEDVVVNAQYGFMGIKVDGEKQPLHKAVADRFKPMLEPHVQRMAKEAFAHMPLGIRKSLLAGYAEALANHVLGGKYRDVPKYLRNAYLN